MPNPDSDPRFYALTNAACGDLEEAARLAEADPSILEARNSIGETALHYLAVEEVEEDEEAVRWLLERGANINTRNSFGATPLMEAAQLRSLAMCRFLLEHGADPRLKDSEGDTALAHAVTADQEAPGAQATLELLLAQVRPDERLDFYFPDVTAHMVMSTPGPLTERLRARGLVDPWAEAD